MQVKVLMILLKYMYTYKRGLLEIVTTHFILQENFQKSVGKLPTNVITLYTFLGI